MSGILWFLVSMPTVTTDGNKIIEKPIPQWTKEDKQTFNFNSKALNSIFNGVSPSEFRLISICKTAKEAWDILETVHEGTLKVKQAKLQSLTIAFENLKMDETEVFNDFNDKLSAIVNSTFYLGEVIPEHKIAKKILRSS